MILPALLIILTAPSNAQAAEPPSAAQQQITPGTIAVRRDVVDPRLSAARAPYEAAVEDALTAAGFTVIPSADNARYAVTLEVGQEDKGAVVTRGQGGSSVSQTGGPGIGGAGLMIGLPNRNPTIGQSVSSQMSFSITRRGESAAAWQGSAVTQQVAGTRNGDASVIAAKLAGALVRNLRQPSGLTVSVP